MPSSDNIFDKAKSLDYLAYLRSVCGEGKNEGGNWRFPCPIHGSDNPRSLELWTAANIVTCYTEGCVEKASIIDFHMALKGMTSREAAYDLLNESIPVAPPRTKEPIKPKEPLSADMLLSTFGNEKLRDAYCASRGITPPIAQALRMGVQTYKRTSELPDEKITASIRYLTIPAVIGDKLYGVKLRRFDQDVKALWDNHLKESSKDYLETTYGSWDKIMDAIGGSRFTFWKDTNRPHIYAYSALYCKEEGRKRKLPYVFITEGEICAASILSKGYFAVSYKGDNRVNAASAFEEVGTIYIIMDKDKAGAIYANKVFDLIGRSDFSVHIVTADGDGDANDMIRYGLWDNWIKQFAGVMPVENMESYIW